MKLLLFGSLFVLLGVVGWAGIEWTIDFVTAPRTVPVAPVFRIVSGARDAGSQGPAIVWHTSTGANDCTVLKDRLKRDEAARLSDLISSADSSAASRGSENVCDVFQLGEVESGVKVEVVGDCGGMARVRILSGPLQDRVGCLANDRLADVPGATPSDSPRTS